MAIPIVEQIAQEIETRLAEITTGNGFNYTLNPARPNRKELSANQRPADSTVLLQTKRKIEDKQYSSAGNPRRVAWRQEFAIDVFGYEDDADTNSVETRLHKMGADVEKKLMEDPQRNTLAIKTELTGSIMVVDTELSGIEITIDVVYRVRENDPYTKAG